MKPTRLVVFSKCCDRVILSAPIDTIRPDVRAEMFLLHAAGCRLAEMSEEEVCSAPFVCTCKKSGKESGR